MSIARLDTKGRPLSASNWSDGGQWNAGISKLVPWLELRRQGGDPELLRTASRQFTPPVDVEEVARTLGATVNKVTNVNWAGALVIEEESAHIFVKSTDARVRQRFTIAHEIGHLMRHDLRTVFRDLPGMPSHNSVEIEANRYAADLLMPEHWVLHYAHLTGFNAASLASLFEVSEQAMTIRLGGLLRR